MLPPAAPAGLSAEAGNAQVALNWQAVAGAANYNAKRAAATGGPYAIIASPTGTNYTDTTAVSGTTYYYVVSALNGGGQGANSVEASARPVSTIPPHIVQVFSGQQFQLNWPSDHLGWRLQAQTNSLGAGLGTNWTTVYGSNSTNQMTVPINNNSVFYRLVFP
jgi:hypothetical protein